MSSPATPRASQQPSLLQLKRVVVPWWAILQTLRVAARPGVHGRGLDVQRSFGPNATASQDLHLHARPCSSDL